MWGETQLQLNAAHTLWLCKKELFASTFDISALWDITGAFMVIASAFLYKRLLNWIIQNDQVKQQSNTIFPGFQSLGCSEVVRHHGSCYLYCLKNAIAYENISDSGRNVHSNVLMFDVIFSHVGISPEVKPTDDQIKHTAALK